MRKPLALAALLATSPVHAAPSNQPTRTSQQQHVRHVDVVLALDTSSSMDGLIDSARQKLWDVVTVLSKAQPQPVLRVGIISYGNTGYDASRGWVQKDIDLSSDLDSVYGKLFALRTNGGDEYVARAVQSATEQMAWSQDQDALKIIFVAGNEAANQDPKVSVGDALAEAKRGNIFVNTIYCGTNGTPEAQQWAAAAHMGRGQFAAIDMNGAVAIVAPQDVELQRLSAELNKTYVAYGPSGALHAANQVAQDKNAAAMSPPAAAARAVGKASSLYGAADWDLVDAARDRKKDVNEMAEAELSDELRAVPKPQRQAYIAGKAKQRAELQQSIASLSNARSQYVAKERAKKPASPAALDDALVNGLKSEAQAQGFKF